MLTKKLMVDFNAKQDYAWQYFFTKYYTPLVFFVNTLVQDVQEAQDIVSKCFEKILVNKELTFEKPENLKAFLYISARNEAYDLLAKQSRKKSILCDRYTIEALEEGALPYPEDGRAQTLLMVKEYIEHLPLSIKEVMLMRFYEGMKAVEIARAKELSVQTVNNQVSAGIRKVKELILKIPLTYNVWIAVMGNLFCNYLKI